MNCRECGNCLRRLARRGFLQVKIFPLFGYYPWECPVCRKTIMVKKQYLLKRRSIQQNSAE